MTKQQLDHVLRAAGEITGEKQFIIIGSQSLHGKYPDLPDEILISAEVDLIAKNNPEKGCALIRMIWLSPSTLHVAKKILSSPAHWPRAEWWKKRIC